jgi:hypothetical protein
MTKIDPKRPFKFADANVGYGSQSGRPIAAISKAVDRQYLTLIACVHHVRCYRKKRTSSAGSGN